MLTNVTTDSVRGKEEKQKVSRIVSKATAGVMIIQKEIKVIIFHKQVITSECVICAPTRQIPLVRCFWDLSNSWIGPLGLSQGMSWGLSLPWRKTDSHVYSALGLQGGRKQSILLTLKQCERTMGGPLAPKHAVGRRKKEIEDEVGGRKESGAEIPQTGRTLIY